MPSPTMIARQNVLVGHDISSNHACPVLTDNVEAQHYMWLLTLEGALCLCPYAENGAKRVLDLGTGTGCWAIEYGEICSNAPPCAGRTG